MDGYDRLIESAVEGWGELPGAACCGATRHVPFWVRGKKSMEVDLGDPADAKVCALLVADADLATY